MRPDALSYARLVKSALVVALIGLLFPRARPLRGMITWRAPELMPVERGALAPDRVGSDR